MDSNVNGLGVSPDGKTLGVIATLTNAVIFIDLATNTVKGNFYVDRNPHEGFFSCPKVSSSGWRCWQELCVGD